MSEKKIYLNLGCGRRYHPDWINIDVAPRGPDVIQYYLSRGIPFSGSSVDVVYHSAVLEHMRLEDAALFMADCHRVLKSSGIVRVGVPDLEKACRLYLSKLASSLNGDQAAAQDYDWILIELLDQMVRESRGGRMLDYLRQNPLPNEPFVFERIGEEGRLLVEILQARESDKGTTGHRQDSVAALLHRLWKSMLCLPVAAKHQILRWLLGEEGWRALEIGRFRLAGEVHQWMYDRYSLARLLRRSGFSDPQEQDAHTSRIANWTSFHLDTLPDGRIIKPDLFFMEAIKPGLST